MAGEIDLFMLEKKAGKDFASRIKRNLLTSIESKTKKKTGKAKASNVTAFYKDNLLDRITIFTPYYIFPILHMGFEGTKSNGVNMQLAARAFISEAVENGRVTEDLANLIGEQRANEIISRINFNFKS